MKLSKIRRTNGCKNTIYRLRDTPTTKPRGIRKIEIRNTAEEKAQIEAAVKAIKSKYYSSNIRISRIENRTAVEMISSKLKNMIKTGKTTI